MENNRFVLLVKVAQTDHRSLNTNDSFVFKNLPVEQIVVVYLVIKMLGCGGPQKTTWNRQSSYEILSSMLFYLLLHFLWWELPCCAAAWGCNQCCGGHIDVSCHHLAVLKTEVIWRVLVWHTYHSWLHFVSKPEGFPASFGYSYCITPTPPPSRLGCDTPDFFILPCVYERETKRGASKRLEGRTTIWQWLFLWRQISNVILDFISGLFVWKKPAYL